MSGGNIPSNFSILPLAPHVPRPRPISFSGLECSRPQSIPPAALSQTITSNLLGLLLRSLIPSSPVTGSRVAVGPLVHHWDHTESSKEHAERPEPAQIHAWVDARDETGLALEL